VDPGGRRVEGAAGEQEAGQQRGGSCPRRPIDSRSPPCPRHLASAEPFYRGAPRGGRARTPLTAQSSFVNQYAQAMNSAWNGSRTQAPHVGMGLAGSSWIPFQAM